MHKALGLNPSTALKKQTKKQQKKKKKLQSNTPDYYSSSFISVIVLKLSYKEQHKEMRAYVAYSFTDHVIVAEKGSWELTLSQSRARENHACLLVC
jgi:hypothetical protein